MKKTLFFLSFLLMLTNVFSQDLKRSPVGDKVQVLKQHATFAAVDLFEQKVLTKSREQQLSQEVTNPVLLNPRFADLQSLINQQPNTIAITLPNPVGEDIELELYRVNLTAPDFQVVTASQGVLEEEFPMAHFRGIIKGEHHSLVAISVFEKEVMGVISGDEGTLVLGKLKGINKTNEHVLYRERDLVEDLSFSCDMPDDGEGYSREELLPTTNRNVGGCTDIYVEVGNDIFANKGGVTGTVNFITGMMNEVAVLYNDLDGSGGSSSDGVEIGVSEIKIWDIADPYSGSGSSANLSTFKAQNGAINGDLGIFVNYEISGGVAAGFNGLCNGDPDQSLSVAGINSSFSSVPTYSWSVFVTAHELGHLFGSRHTHACVWNGDNTSIDGCQRTEGNCRKGSIPSDGGTIMSYCHLKSVGINFTKSFGSQPGTVIFNNVNNASCVTSGCSSTNVVTVGNDPCSNGVQDPGEEGVDCGGDCATPCGGGSCDAPTAVNTTGVTNRNATMNWSGTAGASSYDLDIREVGASSWQTFNSTSTSLSLQGFRRNRTYEWQVRANCTGATSDNSAICSFVTGGASTQSCGGSLITGLLVEEFAVFPNPAKDVLQVSINLPEVEEVQINIIDMMGKRVQSTMIQNGLSNQSVHVGSLAAGIYLIRVENGEQTLTKKIMIQK